MSNHHSSEDKRADDVPLYLRQNAAGKYEPSLVGVPMTVTEVLQRQSPPVGNAYVTAGCEQFKESILQEAHRLTHGPRQADYGHPLDDYTRTAALWSALLAHKLKEPFTAEDAAQCMALVKHSRQVHRPKRDNMVDAAGYAWVAQECRDEQERRNSVSTTTKES